VLERLKNRPAFLIGAGQELDPLLGLAELPIAALEQADAGKLIDHSDVRKMAAKWLRR